MLITYYYLITSILAKRILGLFFIFRLKISAYRRDFDKTKCISFSIKDKKLLEKYNKIWKKVSTIMQKQFGSKPVNNEKCIKSKINSYNRNIDPNIHNNNISYYEKKALSVFLYQ